MLSKEQAEAAADALLKPGRDERAWSQAARESRAAAPVAQPGDVIAGIVAALLGFLGTLPFRLPLVVAALASLVVGVLVGVAVARRRSR